MAAEVHKALDCVDVCDSTERVLTRGPDLDPRVVAAVVESAIAVCEACAAACGAHAGHRVRCGLHSASAATCADALRALQKSLIG
jgi:hypothetical protein